MQKCGRNRNRERKKEEKKNWGGKQRDRNKDREQRKVMENIQNLRQMKIGNRKNNYMQHLTDAMNILNHK